MEEAEKSKVVVLLTNKDLTMNVEDKIFINDKMYRSLKFDFIHFPSLLGEGAR